MITESIFNMARL